MVRTRASAVTRKFTRAGTDPVDSHNVRLAFLARLGRDNINRREVLVSLGWDKPSLPGWLGDGNIPVLWRERLWLYAGGRK